MMGKKIAIAIDTDVNLAKEKKKAKAAPTLVEIRTKVPGVVIGTGYNKLRQMYAVIEASNGVQVIVQHMTSLAVSEGQHVEYAGLVGFRKV